MYLNLNATASSRLTMNAVKKVCVIFNRFELFFVSTNTNC